MFAWDSVGVCVWHYWRQWWMCVCVCVCLCACVWYIICLCVSRHGGGHKIWRIITKKRLGRRWKASYWFLKGPDSSPECFISSALFVLHIKDSIFLWILIAVKTAHPLLAEGRTRALTVSRQKRDVGCMWPLQQAPTCQITKQKMTDMWRCMKMAQNKEKKSRKAVEASLNSLWHRSTKCWKHSSEILVHIDMIASRSCCRFVSCTSMMPISHSTKSKRCSIGLCLSVCPPKAKLQYVFFYSCNTITLTHSYAKFWMCCLPFEPGSSLLSNYFWPVLYLALPLAFSKCLQQTFLLISS